MTNIEQKHIPCRDCKHAAALAQSIRDCGLRASVVRFTSDPSDDHNHNEDEIVHGITYEVAVDEETWRRIELGQAEAGRRNLHGAARAAIRRHVLCTGTVPEA